MEPSDEHGQNDRNNDCGRSRRNRVRVKALQQLDIRSQNGDQTAAVFSLKLRRGQLSQLPEHFLPDERQHPVRKIMTAVLLRVVQHSAQERRDKENDEDRHDRLRKEPPALHRQLRDHERNALQCCAGTGNGKKDRAKTAGRPQKDC